VACDVRVATTNPGRDMGADLPMTHPTQSKCPICWKPLRELERVEARHTPASVPEHARGPYSVMRRYTLVECESGHRYENHGGGLYGSRARGVWHG
jgi:hypothetical protein